MAPWKIIWRGTLLHFVRCEFWVLILPDQLIQVEPEVFWIHLYWSLVILLANTNPNCRTPIVSTVVGLLYIFSRGVLLMGRLDTAIRPITRRWTLRSNWSNMGNVLIYVGIHVIIKGRVIGCPSISNIEDMAMTRTLGREGATYYREWKWGVFTLLLINDVTDRRYLGGYQSPYLRSTNSGKIPRCQTGLAIHFRLMQALVEQATAAKYSTGHTSSVQ